MYIASLVGLAFSVVFSTEFALPEEFLALLWPRAAAARGCLAWEFCRYSSSFLPVFCHRSGATETPAEYLRMSEGILCVTEGNTVTSISNETP